MNPSVLGIFLVLCSFWGVGDGAGAGAGAGE